jgi:hypothetical protein
MGLWRFAGDTLAKRRAIEKRIAMKGRCSSSSISPDHADTGMVESGCGAGFALKSLQGGVVFSIILREKLERTIAERALT